MRRIAVLTDFVSLFLLLVMFMVPFIAPVAASPVIRKVPTEYLTIQAAVDAAYPGDIIQVASGIYYEHVVVNKSLTIVGENSSATIIDGDGTGIVVCVNAPDVEIRGFIVQNAGDSPNSNIHLGGCVRNTIRDNIIRNNAYGIALVRSNDSVIVGNKIMNNSYAGILIRESSNNIIHYNTIVNNSMGVWVTSESSLLNTFFHNNFIDNKDHALSFSSTTKWDNGGEGNYWDDYMGEDLDGDGIGETLLPHLGNDDFPLMERPWSPYRVFSVSWKELTYFVVTFSNSTLASFNFSRSLKKISFNITSGASGFCNVTIPKRLLDGYLLVLVDGEEPAIFILTENVTYSCFYFGFFGGTHGVEIRGSTVVGLLGDLNGNDVVDELDVTLAAMALFTVWRDPDYNFLADVSGDGDVDGGDIRKILLALGQSDC